MEDLSKPSLSALIKKHNLISCDETDFPQSYNLEQTHDNRLKVISEDHAPSAPRSRAESMSEDVSCKFEEELFNHCKLKDTDAKTSSGVLLKELENMGISKEDPRLRSLIEALKAMPSNYGIGNIQLGKEKFSKLVKMNLSLISKAFKGQLVIPDFPSFTEDIVEIYKKCKSNTSGKPAAYIPQLARGDPNKWGVSLCTVDGQRFSVGDVHENFSIQSTSKTFTYAMCLDHLGADVVQKYIGREPSGRNFNEIVLDHNGQPHNPMINSGAIMSAALLLYLVKPEMSVSEKYEYVHDFFSRMCGREHVGFQNSVFLSERDTADRNQALAYFMRESKCFPDGPNNQGGGVDIKNILDFYIQLCSMEMSASSMSVMAGTLANGGICPITGERVLNSDAVKNVLSLMFSCGMYNYSGQFAFQVGLPAKSGVSGIVLVVVPNVVGFALYSPPLDSIGNSARGVMFAEEMVKIYNFHTFDGIGGAAMSGKKIPTNSNITRNNGDLFHILLAASNGDQLALETAHLSGYDMNLADYDNRTALHLAVAENHISCIKYLIQTCKVEIDVKDRWGNTPMSDALNLGRTKVIALLKREQIKRGHMVNPTTNPPIQENGTHEEEEENGIHENGENGENGVTIMITPADV